MPFMSVSGCACVHIQTYFVNMKYDFQLNERSTKQQYEKERKIFFFSDSAIFFSICNENERWKALERDEFTFHASIGGRSIKKELSLI